VGKKSFDKKSAEGKRLDEEQVIKEDIVEVNEKSKENIENNENSNSSDESKKEVEEKQIKTAEEESLNNKLLRLQADFLNYKNRTEKEKTSTYCNAVADVINCLLPVVDNLERALATDTSVDNSFKNGIQMVYTQFIGILDKKGLKEIEALNKPFDHNVHYGVAYDDSSEEEDGTVIEVLQKGYAINDKVIRPSMVRIAKK